MNSIGRVTTGGDFSEFVLPTPNAAPNNIITGSDGALWFSESVADKIGRISTAGDITEYSIPIVGRPYGMAEGSDGALWFIEYESATGSTYLMRLSTSGAFSQLLLSSSILAGFTNLASGSDGALWIPETYSYGGMCEQKFNYMLQVSTAMVRENTYTLQPGCSGTIPQNIITGPDGALWFTEVNSVNNDNSFNIGRLTTSGVLTQYTYTGSLGMGITSGPDGALWFTDGSGSVHRMDTAGNVTDFPLSSGANPNPVGITVGPDGNIWFTEATANRIGMINLHPRPAAPASLTLPSPTQQPSLSWSASDGATSYIVYRDGVDIASTTATSYTDTGATEGSHTYYVTAVNGGGESEPSSTVSVIVDRTAPTVTVTPEAGSTLSGIVTFNITISDANSLSPDENKAVWVYLYDTTGTQKSVGAKVNLSNGTGTFTVDTTKLNEGNANLDVGIVYDAAGNASGAHDNYFRNYTVDN